MDEKACVVGAKEMQAAIDAAVEANEMKEGTYALLSKGIKRLRELEKKEEGVDEGDDSKYVIARYDAPKSYFRLPAQLDPNYNVGVKWGTLHCRLLDGSEHCVDGYHANVDEENIPKRPVRLDFVKEKPWVWDSDPEIDSGDEDFDGGCLQFLR